MKEGMQLRSFQKQAPYLDSDLCAAPAEPNSGGAHGGSAQYKEAQSFLEGELEGFRKPGAFGLQPNPNVSQCPGLEKN